VIFLRCLSIVFGGFFILSFLLLLHHDGIHKTSNVQVLESSIAAAISGILLSLSVLLWSLSNMNSKIKNMQHKLDIYYKKFDKTQREERCD
jgi:hypothetical protein